MLDFSGAAALHHAALWKRESIVEALLDTMTGSSQVNLQDNAGNTPMHYACTGGSHSVGGVRVEDELYKSLSIRAHPSTGDEAITGAGWCGGH